MPLVLGSAQQSKRSSRWSLPALTSRFFNGGGDRMAIWMSGLCIVHCLASTLVLASMFSVGAAFLNPAFHEVGLALAIALGLIVLVSGARRHGSILPLVVGGVGLLTMAFALTMPHDHREVITTIIGVSILALSHMLNRRARLRTDDTAPHQRQG